MEDLKKKYKTVMDDHFPDSIEVKFGDQVLRYKKRTWKIGDDRGDLIEKGLRYGENPGQEAALYELVAGNLKLGECEFVQPGMSLVSGIDEQMMLQAGKHPGKTNLTDVDNALNILKFLMDNPACAIMKHNNPSGVALGSDPADAYHKADMADRIAAFGGAAVFNRAIDKAAAELISQRYLEVVAAPEYENGTLDILKQRKNLRIIKVPGIDNLSKYVMKRFVDFKSLIDGGLVVQQSPINAILKPEDLVPARSVYKGVEYRIDRQPTATELADMVFGWSVEQGVTSNSVLYVKNGCTVGIGTGEQDRVGVAEIAVFKAYTKYRDRLCYERYGKPFAELTDEKLKASLEEETNNAKAGLPGSTMVSDAFFPFRDGVEVGIRQGITAIVHPGGSDRDFESIQACNEADPKVAMMFTNQRAFKH